MEIAEKVIFTLAAILPAKANANDSTERTMAGASTKAKKIHVVLHLEQIAKPSRKIQKSIAPADIQQKMRQLLKSIDPHPLVVESSRMGTLSWKIML